MQHEKLYNLKMKVFTALSHENAKLSRFDMILIKEELVVSLNPYLMNEFLLKYKTQAETTNS